jgi:hypothetical protein
LPGLLGIVISGAGPTVLALATHNFDAIGHKIQELFAAHPPHVGKNGDGSGGGGASTAIDAGAPDAAAAAVVNKMKSTYRLLDVDAAGSIVTFVD